MLYYIIIGITLIMLIGSLITVIPERLLSRNSAIGKVFRFIRIRLRETSRTSFCVISIVELDLICIFIDRTQQVAPDGFLKYGSADKTEHKEGQKFQSDQDKGRPQGNTQSDGSRSVFLHIMHPFSVFNSRFQ